MNFRALSILVGITSLSLGFLPASLTLAKPDSNSQKIAQNVPVGIVGRVSPNQAIRMVIVNGTSAALYAGISGGSRVELPPQGSNTFIFDATPVNVFVYPTGNAISLKYNTTVQGNTVNVRVTQVGGDSPGDGAITIKPSGAIHVY